MMRGDRDTRTKSRYLWQNDGTFVSDGLEQIVAAGVKSCRGPRGHANLVVRVLDMMGDRSPRDGEPAFGLPVRQPAHGEAQHLDLPGGKTVRPQGAASGPVAGEHHASMSLV